MTQWAIVIGECAACHKPFTFNPHLVPSVRVNGVREPICRNCINIANQRRQAAGVELIQILPGAYDPLPENEFW